LCVAKESYTLLTRRTLDSSSVRVNQDFKS
jgi:hypothetical protein